jgi:hypothetical protein
MLKALKRSSRGLVISRSPQSSLVLRKLSREPDDVVFNLPHRLKDYCRAAEGDSTRIAIFSDDSTAQISATIIRGRRAQGRLIDTILQSQMDLTR